MFKGHDDQLSDLFLQYNHTVLAEDIKMKRIGYVFFIFSVFLIGAYKPACSEDEQTIFFYNTESNINNFVSLREGFEFYFEKKGGYIFQPFDLRENFQASIRAKRRGNIYILSNWHLKELQKKKVPLEIAMIGTLKGKQEQKKVLSVTKEIVKFEQLKDTVIAAAGTEDYVHNIIKQMLGKGQEKLLEDITILIVPKDLDALLSIVFGVSTGAVSAENGLEKMKQISPSYYEELHELGASKSDYLLVVATLNKPTEKELQLLEALRKMEETEEGRQILMFLGIDGWRKAP